MSKDSVVVQCARCGTKNRIPGDRWGGKPVCGKCKTPLDLARLYPDSPIHVSDTTFLEEVAHFPGPVLVEFSAPW